MESKARSSIWSCRLDRFLTAFELARIVVKWSKPHVNDLIQKHVPAQYVYEAVGGANCATVMEALCFQAAVDLGCITLPTHDVGELHRWQALWLKRWPRKEPYKACTCSRCTASTTTESCTR